MRRPENAGAVSIAVIVLILHFILLSYDHDLIWDEKPYIGQANYILYGTDIDVYYRELAINTYGTTSIEEFIEYGYNHHMPLSKLFLAAGVGIFGDNALGWRIMPILFGTASIIFFTLICQRLTTRRWLPLIATFIFAFENICFVLSSLALLEVFMFTFVLLAFLLYLDKRYLYAGIAVALATLCKMNGAFVGGVIILHWIIVERKLVWEMIRFAAIALLAYLILMPLFDYIALRELLYPWDRLYNMFDIHDYDFLANVPEQYRRVRPFLFPWEWLISYEPLNVGPDHSYRIHASWTVWAMAIPAMCYMVYESVRDRSNRLTLLVLLWFVCSYFPWFVVYWFFDRVSLAHYFYPATGAICLAIAYAVYRLLVVSYRQSNPVMRWGIRLPAVSFIIAHMVIFWIMAPIL